MIPNTLIFHELAIRFVERQSVLPSDRSYDDELKHIESSHDAGTLAGAVALRDDPEETYQLQRPPAEIEDCITRLLSKAEAENALLDGKAKGPAQPAGLIPSFNETIMENPFVKSTLTKNTSQEERERKRSLSEMYGEHDSEDDYEVDDNDADDGDDCESHDSSEGGLENERPSRVAGIS